MSVRAWTVAAGVMGMWAALIACGEPRLIGRSCGRQGCPPEISALPAPKGCGAQFELHGEDVASATSRERCYLFTLDRLTAAETGDAVYVTRVEVASGPYGHDLDLRLAPAKSLDAFEDGPVECTELAERAITWLPLMTTQGTRDEWDFAPAPLAANRSHRLLVNDVYTNLTPDSVRTAVQVNVHCAASVPSSVSQTFEFTTREGRIVNPGERLTVSAPCAFSKDVLVSRLYRRTRWITSYAVRRLDESEPLWRSEFDWFIELDPPLSFAADEGFRWECVYENRSDLPFEVGGNSSDACSLLGIYRVPGGGADPFAERCIR